MSPRLGLTLDSTWSLLFFFFFFVIVAGLLSSLGFVLLAPEIGPLHLWDNSSLCGRDEGSPLQGPPPGAA